MNIQARLPKGWSASASGPVIAVFRTDLAARLEHLMRMSHATLAGLPGAEPLKGGRASPLRIAVKGLPGGVLVRPYAHGGLAGRVLGARFDGPGRALRELLVSTAASARRLPVPEMLGFTAVRRGFGWTMEAWVRWLNASPPLSHLLARTPDVGTRDRMLGAAGRAVRTCHDGGLSHRDLNSRNVLITGSPLGFRSFVVDLDGARIGRPLGTASRARQLRRLFRSLVKEGAMAPDGGEFARLLSAYGAPFSGPAEGSLIRRARLETRLHSLLWRKGKTG